MRLVFALVLGCAMVAGDRAATAQPAGTGWTGEISAGGSIATGNTSRKAMDADIRAAKREGGLENRFRLLGTVAWETGVTTAQRVHASAQSNVDLRPRTYGFGFAEYDDDRFSGFKFESSFGTGLGYRLLDTPKVAFSVEAGPGYRFSEVKETGAHEDELFARIVANFRYEISENARFTNETLVTYDAVRTKAENTVAVTSKLIGNLSGRVSFNVRYNSNPPVAIKSTDTLTKLSLVYGF